MASPGPTVPHRTTRKRALEFSESSKFPSEVPYDSAAGTPSSQSGGTYDDQANKAKVKSPKPSKGEKPFNTEKLNG